MDDEKKRGIKTDHAWKGVWERPMKIDENSLDPLTVARMTDHNVRGSDEEEKGKSEDDQTIPEAPAGYRPVQGNPEDHGKVTPEEAIRIQSDDLPATDEGEEEEEKKAG
jgi:hypothetical protein